MRKFDEINASKLDFYAPVNYISHMLEYRQLSLLCVWLSFTVWWPPNMGLTYSPNYLLKARDNAPRTIPLQTLIRLRQFGICRVPKTHRGISTGWKKSIYNIGVHIGYKHQVKPSGAGLSKQHGVNKNNLVHVTIEHKQRKGRKYKYCRIYRILFTQGLTHRWWMCSFCEQFTLHNSTENSHIP